MITVSSLILTVLHSLAGAAWFGAMFYSAMVLQPRAQAYFQRPESFEQFISAISSGARWKVLTAFAMVGASGIVMALLEVQRPRSPLWSMLVAGKLVLYLIALAVFIYTSWRLWPARILASAEEVPIIQRRFRRIGQIMLCLIGLSFVLGLVAHST
jgi:putative copper export protein